MKSSQYSVKDEGPKKCPWNWNCGHPERDGTYACAACRYEMAIALDKMIEPAAVYPDLSAKKDVGIVTDPDKWVLDNEGRADIDFKPRGSFAALERLHTGWTIDFQDDVPLIDGDTEKKAVCVFKSGKRMRFLDWAKFRGIR